MHSFIAFSQVNDQMGTPFIVNFTPDVYNSQPQNWAIVQDSRGILYFGNGPETGVMEYDGSQWRIINVSNNSTARSLAIDSTGRIYVGASGEFGYLAADSTGSLKYVSLFHLIHDDHTEFNNILKIHPTSHGIYFLSTDKIFRYHNDQITVLEGKFEQRFGFCVNDNLFVAEKEKGLLLVRNDKFEQLPYTKEIINDCGRYAVYDYHDNQLLIVTVNNGMYRYKLNMISHKNKIFENNTEKNTAPSIVERIDSRVSDYLKENSFYTGVKINDNAYAFGTLQGGVILMDASGELIKVINKNRGLVNNTILSLYADKASNIWVGTYNGIAYVETGSPLSSFNELNGLHGSSISLIKHQDKRYIGTTQGIFHLPEYELKLVDDNHNFNPISNFDQVCWRLFSMGSSLLATGSDGLYEIQENRAERILESSEIYCFGYTDKFPKVLFLGLEDGLSYVENSYDINDKNSRARFNEPKRIPELNHKIRIIVTDNDNNLWLTTEYSGISYIRFDNDDINKYEVFNYDTTHGLPQLNYNWVYNLDGKIVIGSRQGFYKPLFNRDNLAFTFVPDTSFGKQFTSKDMQIDQVFITPDSNAIIYLKNKGIGVLEDPYAENRKWNFEYFKKINEPTQIYYDTDKRLWISSLNEGIFYFNNSLKKDYQSPYNSHIRSVIVGKDSLIFNGAFYDESAKKGNLYQKILQKQDSKNQPVLEYEYNSIRFKFSSSFYEKPDAIQFSWILEGFDKEWTDWSFKTEENYKKIREGDYTFKVKARNVFGKESTIAAYEFTVLPPWHRTIWAYLGYLILFVLFVYIIVRLNSRRLKAANIRLEKIIKERTREIRKQRDQIAEQNQAITDSIQYAKRIQSAVLPPKEILNNALPEHFILFKPRDIVSGDFYWMKQLDNFVVFTAADCTGHGVPGAFMSMLGIALLNEIVRRKEITHASEILNELRKQLKEALRQSGKEGEAKDGMDVAMCVLDMKNKKLQYAGAYNSLFLVRNKELIEYKADKMPIGIHQKTDPFTNHEIDLQKDDSIYIFSDGFVDQFGGKKGKKFMIKPFKRLLAEISDREMEDQKEILDISITEWRGERQQIDDIVVFGVRI
jgi:serine phosphatase RsbU (regulator of sigma subunit)/ligand-binding sensor domain-containing protein